MSEHGYFTRSKKRSAATALKRRKTSSEPFTIHTIPDKVRWKELQRRNSTVAADHHDKLVDLRKRFKDPITETLPGFEFLAAGVQQTVYDGKDIVLKIQRVFGRGYLNTRKPSDLTNLCKEQPKRFVETRWVKITGIPATGEMSVLVQPKLGLLFDSSPEDYEWGVDTQGHKLVYDFG